MQAQGSKLVWNFLCSQIDLGLTVIFLPQLPECQATTPGYRVFLRGWRLKYHLVSKDAAGDAPRSPTPISLRDYANLKEKRFISYVQQFTPRFLFHLMNGWNEFMTYIRHGDPCRHMEASLEGRGLERDHDSGLHFLNERDWKQGGGYLADFPNTLPRRLLRPQTYAVRRQGSARKEIGYQGRNLWQPRLGC